MFSAVSPASSALSFSHDDGKNRPPVGCLHMSGVGLVAIHLVYQVRGIINPFHRWDTEAQKVTCPPSHSWSGGRA